MTTHLAQATDSADTSRNTRGHSLARLKPHKKRNLRETSNLEPQIRILSLLRAAAALVSERAPPERCGRVAQLLAGSGSGLGLGFGLGLG